MSAPSFPQSLQDISPQWLTDALVPRYPGTKVTAVKTGTVIGGMATKARLFLDYNDAGQSHGLPPSMWVKTGWGAHTDAFVSMNATEALFFRDLAPKLPINCPKTYAELLDPNSPNGLILMEDLLLRHVSFGTQSMPLEPAMMNRVLALQAGYQAAFWNSPALDQYPWLKRGGAIVETNVIDMFLGFWDTAETQPRFEKVPAALRDRALMRKALFQMQNNDLRDACCIVHGDSHQANMFFDPDGTPGYLDWATVMRNHWAFDVSYLIVGSQSIENRRRLEREQLRYYLDRLAANGVQAPQFEAAWLAYRQHAMWMFLTAMCPTAMHPEEVCVFNTERACAAIMDLETIKSLECA